MLKESWSGKLEATTQPDKCVQQNILLKTPVEGNEDCLYLNIYRPSNLQPGQKVQIVVYIHGGGFFFGSSDPAITGPRYIMEQAQTKPVILVVIQYRLSALGFFSTGDSECPGNNGFKDQRTALDWVIRNIDPFGGDVNDLTKWARMREQLPLACTC